MVSLLFGFFHLVQLRMLDFRCPKCTSAGADAKASLSYNWLKICGVNMFKPRREVMILCLHTVNLDCNLLNRFSQRENQMPLSASPCQQCRETGVGQMLLQQNKPAQWVIWHQAYIHAGLRWFCPLNIFNSLPFFQSFQHFSPPAGHGVLIFPSPCFKEKWSLNASHDDSSLR